MSGLKTFAALCLAALVCGFVAPAANAAPTPNAQSQVALNPQPLPPLVDHDFDDFDEG